MTSETAIEFDTAPAESTGGEPRHVETIIIGSGFAGLGMAIRLSRDGISDYLVLERGHDVGGTWRDNVYPGAACDVPSQLYSYSFAPNRGWTRSYSRQPEIQAYLADVSRRFKVLDKHIFGCEVLAAQWDNATARWELDTSRGKFSARILIPAIGALCEPAFPAIEGIESFAGTVLHTARWPRDVEQAGLRVALIGTGASGVQVAPAIADAVARLDIYQRTAPWILPRLERRYSLAERLALRYLPGWREMARAVIYLLRESQAAALVHRPALLRPVEALARAQLRLQIRDRDVRRRATPDFAIGCKRILVSNDYYRILNRHHVRLVTEPIARIVPEGIVTEDGTLRPVDAIIVATGFHVTDSPTYTRITGRDGRTLAQVFDQIGRECYKGTAFANFPNMFFLVGPNTGLGHTSMVLMIEAQLNYIADAVATIRRRGLRTVEVREFVQQAYSRMLKSKLSGSIWNTGGCASWYIDKHGDNTTLWPGFTFEFRRITKEFDIEAYQVSPARTGSHDTTVTTDTAASIEHAAR